MKLSCKVSTFIHGTGPLPKLVQNDFFALVGRLLLFFYYEWIHANTISNLAKNEFLVLQVTDVLALLVLNKRHITPMAWVKLGGKLLQDANHYTPRYGYT